MTYYVTKYALTGGIQEAIGEIKDGTRLYTKTNGYPQSFSQLEYWPTREEAVADCERRRNKKIKSLEEQIAKLKKLKFA